MEAYKIGLGRIEVTVATERMVYAEYGRTLIIRPADGEDLDALFDQVCEGFDNTRIEQDSEGNVYIMAPTGRESSYRNSRLTGQLDQSTERDGRGHSFDSNGLFLLPDGSKRAPDASWVSNKKLAALSKTDRRKFLGVVPEFVIGLKSPTDKLTKLKVKLETWMLNGVEFGWLIDPDKRTVLVYRKAEPEPRVVSNPLKLYADGPVSGFVLNLEPIWTCLSDL